MVRAAIFQNAQTEEMFLDGTQIMRSEPFKLAIETRKKMRRSKIAEFLILRIEKRELNWRQLYERIRKGIRTEDLIGVLDENDTCCYVILTNAGVENLPIIQKRLGGLDIESKFIDDLEIE